MLNIKMETLLEELYRWQNREELPITWDWQTSSFVHMRGVMIIVNLREIKPGFLIPTMKPIDN